MLVYDNNPEVIYFAESLDGDVTLGHLLFYPPRKNILDYQVILAMPIPDISLEQKEILAKDMIDFIVNADNYIKADS